MNNLGLKIKELRIETELTQGELAKVLGMEARGAARV